jgi:cytochrome c oxidase cbb3-type subunit 2
VAALCAVALAPAVLISRALGAAVERAPRAQPAAPNGKAVYDQQCARCHGVTGAGDGPAGTLLEPPPRDFTSARYKIRTTETGSLPTDEDLARSIREGLPGTSMPAFGSLLSDADVTAVIAHLKTFSPRFASEAPRPVAIGAPVPPSAASVAAGRTVYETLQCGACHGEDGRGTGALATEFSDDWGHDLEAADLSEPWTFVGGSSTRDLYLRFRTGMNGTPMPSFIDSASDQEMWHLANYVASLARKPASEMTSGELTALYDRRAEAVKSDPVRHGRRLVNSLGCVDCHSPLRADGGIVTEFRLAGGQRWRLNPYGDVVTANLTSDKETGLAAHTDEEFKRAVTRGIRRDGSRMLPFPMPWTSYANLRDDDLSAILAYLRTVAPISNRIPPPSPRGFFSYLGGKFQMLVMGQDPPAYVYPGNAGRPEPAPAASSRTTKSFASMGTDAISPAPGFSTTRNGGVR